jgi:hypothetical protein
MVNAELTIAGLGSDRFILPVAILLWATAEISVRDWLYAARIFALIPAA